VGRDLIHSVIPLTERPDLANAAAQHGFGFRAGEGMIGWDESAYTRFTLRQIEDDIEAPWKAILSNKGLLPEFDGKYPLVGCWLAASKAVGLGIREDRGLVTGQDARFVPHVILD